MKNFLCLLSVLLLVFTSCSKDDTNDSGNLISPILLKNTTRIGISGNLISVNILYQGNKVVSSISDNGNGVKYFYGGTKIVRQEFIEKGILQSSLEYTYDDEKLIDMIEVLASGEKISETKYTYSEDGSIFYEQSKNAGNQKVYIYGVYRFLNGNLIRNEKYDNGFESIDIYEYDNMNNPAKNILGLNLLLEPDGAANNNVVKKTEITSNTTKIMTFDYKYNKDNYPLEKIERAFNSETEISTSSVKYFY